ncbi:outer membrane protein assembly factor BamA [Pseudoroseicyclus sp. CXY001]|uniref:outer membrane protein assembly factor BamA n=1 Tax=Pseudoroseicyclus sp. CXY001 TaxID=3242492 RepID=UPI00358DCBFA
MKRPGGRAAFYLGALSGVVLSALTAFPAVSQSFSFTNVQIEGNQRIEPGTILSYAGIARGEVVSAGELNAAGQAIRQTGLFESVDIVPSGSTLVIRVVEYPMISQIGFEGNARIGDEELGALVRSTPRQVFNPNIAEADVAAITEAYAAQGRINAAVTAQIIERSDNRVDLVFEIAEGGVSEVERISFIGNDNYSERRLRGVLETKQAGPLDFLVQRDTFVAERIAADREALSDFYRSRGYVDFTIQNVDVTLTRARDGYLITYNVEEGQQYRIGNVTLGSEMPEAPASEFTGVTRLREGSVYSPVTIDEDIARLERMAIRLGIPFVAVEPRITRNPRDLTLDIQYVLVRAPRQFVERIDIEGNNTTLDRVIRNQFRTVEGDPFNAREIRESADRIRALGYFAAVDVNTRPGTAPDQMIVDVDVTEQPTGRLTFGGNYNSDTGLSFVASYSEANFLGRGQGIEFDLSTSKRNRVLSFNFTEPQLLGRNLGFGLESSYRQTNNDAALYDTETFRFSPSLSFPVSENGRLTGYVAAEYTDIYNVAGSDTPADTTDDPSVVIINEAAQGGLWATSVGYSYSYDTRRSGLDPTSGVLLRFGQEFGVGDTEFIRTTAQASAETRVFNEEVVLRATVEGGYLDYSKGNSRVTDRYFLGSRYIRGFEYHGIGPRDAVTGDALGGNAFAVARLEAEFPLGLPTEYGISGGAFLDYGSLWEVGNTYGASVLYDDFTPRATVGVSIFWDTPLGPLRFNFTEPLMAEDFDETRSFELTIATSF